MLQGKLSLHELEDVEAVCANVLHRSGLELSYHDREDCLAFLIDTAWIASLSYHAGTEGSRFGIYLVRLLRHRITDWQRGKKGRTKWQFADRTYERILPDLIPLDDRPDGPDSLGALDTGRDSESPLEWILRERDSEGARADDALGEAATRRVAA